MLREKNKNFAENNHDNSVSKQLILFNDDKNTFEHVISTLVQVCNYDPIQAEQCAVLTHYKGNSIIKTGSLNELKPIQDELMMSGLKSEII